MSLVRCVFCGKEYDDFTGMYLIKNEGTMNFYCSSKCRKNHLKLGRDKRKLKWTSAFYESRDKRYAAEKKAHDKHLASEEAAKHPVEHKAEKATKKK